MAKKKVNKRKDYSFEAKIRLPAYERAAVRRRMQFSVIRGPGLKQIDIISENEELKAYALRRHAKLKFFQAKSEDEIILLMKESNTWASGILLHLGSLTHESGLIKKAIKSILIPVREFKPDESYPDALAELILGL